MIQMCKFKGTLDRMRGHDRPCNCKQEKTGLQSQNIKNYTPEVQGHKKYVLMNIRRSGPKKYVHVWCMMMYLLRSRTSKGTLLYGILNREYCNRLFSPFAVLAVAPLAKHACNQLIRA